MPTVLIARLRAVREHADAGVSLMELLVSMALMTILGTLTLMLFLNVNSSTAATTDRTLNTASARNALEAWTGYLQVADGTTAGSKTNRIEWLTATDMLFYADINNRNWSSPGTMGAPTMMWLRLDAKGQLVEEQFTSTATAGTAPAVCRVLGSNVSQAVNADGVTQPVFSAADVTGATITGTGTAPTPSSGCQNLPVTVPSQTKSPDPVAQANLVNVRSVTIDFQMRDGTNQHPIEFTSQAVLPNLGSI